MSQEWTGGAVRRRGPVRDPDGPGGPVPAADLVLKARGAVLRGPSPYPRAAPLVHMPDSCLTIRRAPPNVFARS
ncbi:hypothetical protein GCM10018781_52400 [Kitasatospora indigofera]|uniref:Uncharacterized protein n=1 Tax=Kitasatospora indigofera TaxID=67307 RepID=A0A919KZ17_9ACTN|nr:hypothetical protein GCM10018781_52400 [Kitasatospora indigofera]